MDLDLGILTGAGVTARRPPKADERGRAAERELGNQDRNW